MSSPETFPGETFERLLASAIAADWRTNWRTATKIPANRHIQNGLENRYLSLGGSRVRISPLLKGTP
jgi:hypothetical protein